MSDREVVTLLAIACVLFIIIRRHRKRFDLDRVLFWWGKHDPFRLRDLLAGGLLILGMTGSGKSSSSGRLVMKAVIVQPDSYGLILCAKPEDRKAYTELFRRLGQSKRLIIMDGEKSPLRFNLLKHVGRRGDTQEIVKCLRTISETLRRGEGNKGGENNAFYDTQEDLNLTHAITIIKAAKGEVTSDTLHHFFVTAAITNDQLLDPTWKKTFHAECLDEAWAKPLKGQDKHDLDQALKYFIQVYPNQDERVRSNTLAGLLGLLFIFNNGLVHSLLSTTTNLDLKALRRKRQWLAVDMCPTVYGQSGVFVNAAIKYIVQRDILETTAKPGDPFHTIIADEAHNFANPFDPTYLAQSRSHLGCMVYLTQSIQSFHTAIQSPTAKSQTLSLLGNFTTRIFHALGETSTARWASDSLGQHLETYFGGSSQPAGTLIDEIFGVDRTSTNYGTRYAPVLQPSAFMNGLRTGGPRNHNCCDAIVIRPGVPFSNGQNYLKTTFHQE